METPGPIKAASKAPPTPAAKSAAPSHHPTTHSPLSAAAARLGNRGMQELLRSSAPAIAQSRTSVPPGIGGPPVTVRTDAAATTFLRDNHAAGATLDASTIAVDPRYANSTDVLPHEYAHIAQLRSGRTASRAESEHAATNYARGLSSDPGGAAAPPLFRPIVNIGLDDNPLRPEVDRRLSAEARDIPKLGPQVPGSTSKVEALLDQPDFSSEDRNLLEVTVNAAGDKGSTESLTRFTLHRDREQQFGFVFVGPPPKHSPAPAPGDILTANDIEGRGRPGPLRPAVDVPTYPIILKYERVIRYTDSAGRKCNVIATSTMYFTYDSWDLATSGATASLATIQSLKADMGLTGIMIAGHSKLLTYDARSFSEALTIDAAITQAQVGLHASQGFKDAADLPMRFVGPDETAGSQFETLQAVLVRLDQKEQERIDKMKVVDFFSDDSDDEDDDDWELPDWLKGIGNMLSKVLLPVAAAVGIAAALVYLPLGLTFATAFGLVMLTMATYSLGSSLISRLQEARQEGIWNPLAIIAAALGDLIGVAGLYEGATNQSFLSSRDLNLTDVQRWEVGSGGVLGIILSAFGARALAKHYYKAPGLEPVIEPGTKPQASPEPVRDVDPDLIIRDEQIAADATTRRSGRPYIDGRRVPDKDFNEPKPGTRRLDVEDIQRPGETRVGAVGRLRTIIGKTISDTPFAPAWNRIVTRLKGGKTVTELGRDQTLAIYERAQGELWTEVAENPALRQHLNDAGIAFEPGHRAPLVQVNDPAAIPWYERKINLDHLAEKAIGDNWKRALDADNLEFQPQGPNQYREALQARHPNLRPDSN